MFKESTEKLVGNDAFEGYAIDLIAEIAKILRKCPLRWHDLTGCLQSRIQLHIQMGGRRGLRLQKQGDGGVEWTDGGTLISGQWRVTSDKHQGGKLNRETTRYWVMLSTQLINTGRDIWLVFIVNILWDVCYCLNSPLVGPGWTMKYDLPNEWKTCLPWPGLFIEEIRKHEKLIYSLRKEQSNPLPASSTFSLCKFIFMKKKRILWII